VGSYKYKTKHTQDYDFFFCTLDVYEMKVSKGLPFNFVSFHCNFQLKKQGERHLLETFQCHGGESGVGA
jgi:hypothetical protein